MNRFAYMLHARQDCDFDHTHNDNSNRSDNLLHLSTLSYLNCMGFFLKRKETCSKGSRTVKYASLFVIYGL